MLYVLRSKPRVLQHYSRDVVGGLYMLLMLRGADRRPSRQTAELVWMIAVGWAHATGGISGGAEAARQPPWAGCL